MKKQLTTPEFLFIFYVFGFAMLRPVLFLFRSYSTIIIALFIIIVLLISVINNHVLGKKNFVRWLIISIFFEVLLYVSPSIVSETYMINYFMYGIVSLYLLINVSDYKLVLQWVIRFSCVNGVLLIADPFLEYQFNGGYMEYGFNMLMFSFVGILIGYFYLKNQYFFIPIVIELIMISFYGNKGACVTAVILLLGGMIISGSSIKRWIK